MDMLRRHRAESLVEMARGYLEECLRLRHEPWGRRKDGGEIREVSGKVMRAMLLELEDLVFDQSLAEASAQDEADGAGLLQANLDLFEVRAAFIERLSELLPSTRYTLTRNRLLNEWNYYSYEFAYTALAMAMDLAQIEDFPDRIGRRCMPPALIAMVRPFTMDQVVGQFPRMASRFISRVDIRIEELHTRHASLSLRCPPELDQQMQGHALFARHATCAIMRSTLASLPVVLRGLKPMHLVQLGCQARGDPVCRWNVRWQTQVDPVGPGLLGGFIVGAVSATQLLLQSEGAGRLWALPGLLLPCVLGLLSDQVLGYRRKLAERTAVVREQVAQFELQYAQLQSQNSELQAYNADLEDKVRERTADLEKARRALEEQASTDALTGLWNRHFFNEFISRETIRAHRYGVPLSVIMVDVDHFKHYNDTNGHQQGDEALRWVARTLQTNLRESDAVARYGGEEFVVVLPETPLEGAVAAAEKLRSSIAEQDFLYGELQPLGHLSISLGIGTLDLHDEDEHHEKVVGRADDALYTSKEFGRDRVSVSLVDYLASQTHTELRGKDKNPILTVAISMPDRTADTSDAVLEAMRSALMEAVRKEDTLAARDDGTWYVVMPLGEIEQAPLRIERLRQELRQALDALAVQHKPRLLVVGCTLDPRSTHADPTRILKILDVALNRTASDPNASGLIYVGAADDEEPED